MNKKCKNGCKDNFQEVKLPLDCQSGNCPEPPSCEGVLNSECVLFNSEDDITLCGDFTIPENSNVDEAISALILSNQFICERELLVQNMVFVDTTYGDDTTGVRENPSLPFATLWAARDAAQYGDVVYVRPSDMVIDNTATNGTPYNSPFNINLWKDGVTYYFKSTKITILNESNVGEDLYLFKPTGSDFSKCIVLGDLQYNQIGIGDPTVNCITNFFNGLNSDGGVYYFYAKGHSLSSNHSCVLDIRGSGSLNYSNCTIDFVDLELIDDSLDFGGAFFYGALVNIHDLARVNVLIKFKNLYNSCRIGFMFYGIFIESSIIINGDKITSINSNFGVPFSFESSKSGYYPVVNINVNKIFYNNNNYLNRNAVVWINNTLFNGLTLNLTANFEQIENGLGSTHIVYMLDNELSDSNTINISGSLLNRTPTNRTYFYSGAGTINLISFNIDILNVYTSNSLTSSLVVLNNKATLSISNCKIKAGISGLFEEYVNYLFIQKGSSRIKCYNSDFSLSNYGVSIVTESKIDLKPVLVFSNCSIINNTSLSFSSFKVNPFSFQNIYIRNSSLSTHGGVIFTMDGMFLYVSNSIIENRNNASGIFYKPDSVPGSFYSEKSLFKVNNLINVGTFNNAIMGDFYVVDSYATSPEVVNIPSGSFSVNSNMKFVVMDNV